MDLSLALTRITGRSRYSFFCSSCTSPDLLGCFSSLRLIELLSTPTNNALCASSRSAGESASITFDNAARLVIGTSFFSGSNTSNTLLPFVLLTSNSGPMGRQPWATIASASMSPVRETTQIPGEAALSLLSSTSPKTVEASSTSCLKRAVRPPTLVHPGYAKSRPSRKRLMFPRPGKLCSLKRRKTGRSSSSGLPTSFLQSSSESLSGTSPAATL
mmetsp:Transcript_15576/g.35638  ORF Transcript_15576/g.35638 Transcript_15576/m.35638 type:complete len:216 (-) Transcript_15576:711-1358(-)